MLKRIGYSVGNLVRETGIALDRVGMRMQGDQAFVEQLSRHRRLMNLYDKKPTLGLETFVAPSASVIGAVSIGQRSSVWYSCVLRGDVNSIEIGENSSLQDRVVVHTSSVSEGKFAEPTKIGNNVTVGQGCILHAVTLNDDCFIGMGSHLMDGVVVESNAIVGASSVVAADTVVKSGQMWAGNPAQYVRDITAEEKALISARADRYHELAMEHQEETDKTWMDLAEDQAERKRRMMDIHEMKLANLKKDLLASH
jgi:carbonic anhydrase/acetyltransferase-like protein (isoleucine patch superfamily)